VYEREELAYIRQRMGGITAGGVGAGAGARVRRERGKLQDQVQVQGHEKGKG